MTQQLPNPISLSRQRMFFFHHRKQWQFPNNVTLQVLYHHALRYDQTCRTHSIIMYLADNLSKLAGYSCHPDEKQIDIEQLAQSQKMEFVVKSGFDLDQGILRNFTTKAQEFISEESENVMSPFD